MSDELRADDAEPLTEEWLHSVGFSLKGKLSGSSILLPPRHKEAAIAELCICIGDPLNSADKDCVVYILQGVPDDPNVPDDHVLLTSMPPNLTRGDVRRLCAALGVPLEVWKRYDPSIPTPATPVNAYDEEMQRQGYRYRVVDTKRELITMYTRTISEVAGIKRGWPERTFDVTDLTQKDEVQNGSAQPNT